MALPTTHRWMTAREYFELPEGPPYFQLVNGELFMSPSPALLHQRVLLRLSSAIFSYLQTHPIGEVIVAPSDVQLTTEDVFEPDIYYVSQERAGILGEHGAEGAPDLVVEILSPSTARLDLNRKREIYLRAGVRELWFIDLKTRQIAIHEQGTGGAVILRTVVRGEVLESALLPGLAIETNAIFA